MRRKWAKWSPERIEEIEAFIDEHITKNEEIHTLGAMCIELNIAPSTFYDWAKKHKKIDLLRKIFIENTARIILRKSLEGEYNSAMAKFYLQTQLGYTTKHEDRQHAESVKKTEIALKNAEIQLLKLTNELDNMRTAKQDVIINFGIKQAPEDTLEDVEI